MSIEELKYFITISKCGSFNKAAAQLNISQQGLSRAIKNLETELGENLFIRTSRGVVVSEFGKDIIEYANKVLEASSRLDEFVQSSKNRKNNVIRIGLRDIGRHSTINSAVINTVEDFAQIKGESVVIKQIFESQYVLLDMLKAREIDVVQTIGPVESSMLNVDYVYRSKLYVIANKSYGLKAGEKIRVEDLKDYPMVFPSQGNPYCNYLEELCQKAGFEPKIASYENGAKTLSHAIYRGHGIGFLPDPASGAVCQMYPDMCKYEIEPVTYFDYSFVTLKSVKKTAILDELIKYVVSHAEGNIIPNLI